MTRKEQIKSAYKLTGSNASFYDGMMTYSTLPGKADGRKDNGVLSGIHDDRSYEVVLPDERKEEIQRKGSSGDEGHRRSSCSRSELLFLEYGIPSLSGRERL